MKIDPGVLFAGSVQWLLLLLAISIHESAHAWAASRLGDTTGQDLGRLTLNPFRHVDLIGSLLLPVLLIAAGTPVFGWGRPTPVRLAKLRQPARDHILVVLAGPAANLALAGAALIALMVTLRFTGEPGHTAAMLSLLKDTGAAQRVAGFPVLFALVQLTFLNGFLALFHLLPVPPLDGGELAVHFLPPDWAAKYSAVRPYGFMIVLVLAMLNVVALLAVPVYVVIALMINLSSL